MDYQSLSKYSNDEWAALVARIEGDLVLSWQSDVQSQIGSTDFNGTIDHTLLKVDATTEQLRQLCIEARTYSFATVCVRPEWVRQCVADLEDSSVKVATVIGFHEGTYDLEHKLSETETSLTAGAAELDVFINYPQLKARKYATINSELNTLRACSQPPVLMKLILETSQLDRSQIIAGCVMAAAANFDFVKTSTGFNGQGATLENVRLMAACCEKLSQAGIGRSRMRVKASGGIRTFYDAMNMLKEGAARLGTSGGVGIVTEANEKRVMGHIRKHEELSESNSNY